MRIVLSTLITSTLFAALVATPAFAGRGGGSGGDREPAGGAFMTSYPEPGSTGVQWGGPPRSVDIPRYYYYERPETTGSVRRAPWKRYPRW
jgi:hypothetical protein